MRFQAPRGVYDQLPEEQAHWDFARETAARIAARFGYGRIETPAFEDAALFERGVGAATDIVEKETYTFEDRGGEAITLRAEGTAPVCRAYIQHGMANRAQPVRMFYICPVFRYERPQAGRYRQHTQFGIEIIGESDASADAEVIELGWRYLESVGLTGLTLAINSIGDSDCRPAYVERLRDSYAARRGEICEDCARRIDRNPLRLLDCKNAGCQRFIEDAPASADHLCAVCESHWEDLRGLLAEVGIEYEVNHRLVRGLDYYTRTVFEISPPEEGRMVTIIGGGRYDGLIEALGGAPTPGIGFGMGLERVIQNMRRQGAEPPADERARVLVAHLGGAAKSAGARLASELRRAGIAAALAPPRGLRAQLRYASGNGFTHAAILGEDELAKGAATLRDLRRSSQREVALADLPAAVCATISDASAE